MIKCLYVNDLTSPISCHKFRKHISLQNVSSCEPTSLLGKISWKVNYLQQGSISSRFLRATFMHADPKRNKSFLTWLSFFALLGSAWVKAARKMLMKLTADVTLLQVNHKLFSLSRFFFSFSFDIKVECRHDLFLFIPVTIKEGIVNELKLIAMWSLTYLRKEVEHER